MAQFFWHILLSNHVKNQANQQCTKCYHLQPHRNSSPQVERAMPVRQSSFLGHVLRFPESEPFREFATYVSTHWRRKPVGKRTLFTSYIHCLLGDPNSLLSDNQLLEMAAINGGNFGRLLCSRMAECTHSYTCYAAHDIARDSTMYVKWSLILGA